eukprot:CFRG2691T1
MSGRVAQDHLERLQQNPEHIRHICVLAHVDHGKTSLSDSLIASNAIISHRLAGKVRYLDSREDEQERGITMKSSLISILHIAEDKPYLINLIDSPGHVDFSSEVSTAVKLSDGALIIVDVSEGVCAQTHAVLRQAYIENIRPVLVLNKVDRLVTELMLSPDEALVHLQKILEQVNAVMATLFTGEFFEKDANRLDGDSANDRDHGVDVDDDSLYFEPEKENVVFASAADGWAFGIRQFADTFAQKLKCNQSVLMKTLWGDYYYNASTKKIMRGAHAKNKKPLFVHFVLESLWAVYNVVSDGDLEKTNKIATSLKVKLTPRVLKGDSKLLLQTIMRGWLPLPQAVLDMVVRQLPCPTEIPEERRRQLYYGGAHPSVFPQLTQDMYAYTDLLNHDDLPRADDNAPGLLAYVSKMESFDWDALPQNQAQAMTSEEIKARRAAIIEKRRLAALGENTDLTDVTDDSNTEDQEANEITGQDKEENTLIGFARVYCGTLKVGDSVYVLGPKHNPNTPNSSTQCNKVTITALYIIMGKDLMAVSSVGPGNICGIGGLAKHVYKTATISSSPYVPALFSVNTDEAPIVRVAVEPFKVSEMPRLVEGLRILNQADSMVQVSFTERGEHILHTAGEVHLERCLKDLRERYARIQIRVSAPVVPFRETVALKPKTDMVNESLGENNVVVEPRVQDSKHLSLSTPTSTPTSYEGRTRKSPSPTLKNNVTLRTNNEEHEYCMDAGVQEEGDGVYVGVTPDKSVKVRIRTLPLPSRCGRIIDEYGDKLRHLTTTSSSAGTSASTFESMGEGEGEMAEWKQKLQARLRAAFREASRPGMNDEDVDVGDDLRAIYAACVDKLWSFGPKGCGPNILINGVRWYNRHGVLGGDTGVVISDDEKSTKQLVGAKLDSSIVNGFQNATAGGPLCEEPMRGVMFVVEDIWVAPHLTNGNQMASLTSNFANSSISATCKGMQVDGEYVGSEKMTTDNTSDMDVQFVGLGATVGQMVSVVKDTCRKAFLNGHPRIMVAQYACDIQASSEVLGRVYGVVSKRDGVVLSETMREGSDIFTIKCLLPVRNSFGFADEIRKRTSGAAFPQLVFSHWEAIPVDPFWQPSTAEELLHFGDIADTVNLAMEIIKNVRKRKGLRVKEKLVQHGEKQRTLGRNK